MPDPAPRKQIPTSETNWKFYNKLAKALTKKEGYTVYVNATVHRAMVEYAENHPELGVKA